MVIASEPPRIISMTMTSRCNLRCVMCDHGIRKVEKEDFDADLVDQVAGFIPSASLVDLTGLGEPLLSDLFWKILDRYPVSESAPDRQYFLTFNSNGTLLNDHNIDRILAAGVRKVRISIDAADSDLFEKIRGTDLSRIVSGVRNLVSARNFLNRSFPKIGVEMTLMKENLHDVCPMIDLCKVMGVDFLEVWSLNELPKHMSDSWTVKKTDWTFNYNDQLISAVPPADLKQIVDQFHEYARQRGLPVSSRILEELLESAEFSNLKQWEPANFEFLNIPWREESIRCILPWLEARVTYEGDVFTCCWGPKPIGNLRTATLESIWNNEAVQEMRSDLIDGKIPRRCSGAACRHIKGEQRPVALEWVASPSDIPAYLEIVTLASSYEGVTGLYNLEKYEGRSLRWSNGNTRIPILIRGQVPPKSLSIKVWNLLRSDTHVHITANDASLFDERLPLDGLHTKMELPRLEGQDQLVIKMESDSFRTEGDTRQLGVAIESLRLSASDVSEPMAEIQRSDCVGLKSA